MKKKIILFDLPLIKRMQKRSADVVCIDPKSPDSPDLSKYKNRNIFIIGSPGRGRILNSEKINQILDNRNLENRES